MKILVSGASGLVGSALVPALREAGHEVGRLVRAGPGVAATASAPSAATDIAPSAPAPSHAAPDVWWDVAAGRIDEARLAAYDAVVHLAGENVAAGRWSAAVKERIRSSRVDGTALLARALARLGQPARPGTAPRPRLLVMASAVGYYGDRGGETLVERSGPGRGFLSDVCVAWEAAAGAALESGVRVVALRFGVVLAARGGALAKMLLPFRLGLGGPIGDGRQFMPWITLDDAVAVVLRAVTDGEMRGPINAVAPQAATNREFTQALARVLWRPAVLPLPAFAARLAFGEMADALLLASARVRPERLEAAGFRWRDPALEPALRRILGRERIPQEEHHAR